MDKTYSLVQDTKETFSIEESWLKFPKYWYMWYHKLNKLRYLKATTGWLHDSIKDTVFSEIFIICFKILKVLFNFNYWVSLNLIASFFTDNKWHVVIEEEMVITYAISILNFHFHLPDPTQRGKYIVHTQHADFGSSIARHREVWQQPFGSAPHKFVLEESVWTIMSRCGRTNSAYYISHLDNLDLC